MASVVKTKTIKLSANSDYTQNNFDTPTLPTGASWTRWKVECSAATTAYFKVKDKTRSNNIDWDTWYTNMDLLLLSGVPRLYFNNQSSQYQEYTATLTLEYFASVTAGNKILATDRSQTGTPTTQYAVMTDTHWASGTKITASAFNSVYGS